MLSKTIFAQNIAMLAEIYDKSLTKTLQSVYYAVLQEMGDEDFKQAVKRLLQERVFATFPKPAEILSLSNVKKEVILEVDETELKAKELIDLVHGMDYAIEQKHSETSIDYNTLLNDVKFPTLSDEDKAILNNVAPHYGLKVLIANIRTYQTTKDALNAFKQAIKQSERSGSLEISSDVRKMIKG